MQLNLRRVVIFTPDVAKLAAFYRDVVGLEVVGQEPGWIDFAAGPCNIALHKGTAVAGKRPPKLVFYAADVAAARAALVKRGAKGFGAVKSAKTFDMCDGRDPDGNPIQISSRK